MDTLPRTHTCCYIYVYIDTWQRRLLYVHTSTMSLDNVKRPSLNWYHHKFDICIYMQIKRVYKYTFYRPYGLQLYAQSCLKSPTSKWSHWESPWRPRALVLFEGHAVGPGTITAPWHCYSVIGTFQRRAEQNFTALDSPWEPHLMLQSRRSPGESQHAWADSWTSSIVSQPLSQRQMLEASSHNMIHGMCVKTLLSI